MNRLRVGTRGSELALRQTESVCMALTAANPKLEFEQVVIQTYGDLSPDQPIDASFPAGGFVSAIERALLDEHIDFAVHSYKDLQTQPTGGLVIAAIPHREPSHDVLISRKPILLDKLPEGMRIGTSSARRRAQLLRFANVEVVSMRGNVATRLAKLHQQTLDGIVLAAAGLRRLNLSPANLIDLPTDHFLSAPGQGALAVQTQVDDEDLIQELSAIDHAESRRVVIAERTFLEQLNAGCHTPVAALASIRNGLIELDGELFSDDGTRFVRGSQSGVDPMIVGRQLADLLKFE
ncbi:MAG: hydroxymethylbilane synthase [Planctomycetes bacterium]|nr:hydroxymethylbilane synthase [Planctomycetota bacterium]